jgi:hypothetical protein
MDGIMMPVNVKQLFSYGWQERQLQRHLMTGPDAENM